jgi:hypothetical protein
VVIHGGPQARDPWGFNLMCQFSAWEVSEWFRYVHAKNMLPSAQS